MTWEYIAGFFDGEGTIAYIGRGFRLVISQTNREVLEAIKDFTGVGYVSLITKRKKHWKDAWIFYVARQEHVLFFLKRMVTLLVVKKDKAERVIEKLIPEVKRQHSIIKKRSKQLVEMRKLRAQGLTYREIGNRVGLNWSFVRRRLIKN